MTSSREEIRPQNHRPEAAPRRRRPKVGRWLLGAAVLFGALAFIGITDRSKSDARLATWTNEQAVPTVNLVTPQKATENQSLTLPADVEAFYTAPIHSRVDGYVRMWYFDIGAHVKTGDILARIDTPDLDQRYEQAKGELGKAQADYNLAMLTADRWKALRTSQAVSQQTSDEKAGDASARKAEVSASQANLDRVKAMENFKDIVAPFDGTVTQRNIDVGALVSANNQSAKPLFEIAATKQMRVYVRVPQVYTAHMKKGMPVALKLPQFTDKSFTGTLETTSDAISQTARALTVEAIFPNPDGQLTPGAYAQAKFELPLDPDKLVIPSSAMIFRDKAPEVALVEDGKVVLKKVTILLDTGSQIEVGSGLKLTDRVIVSPSDSVETGDEVKVGKVDGKVVDASGKVDGKAVDPPGKPAAAPDKGRVPDDKSASAK